MSAIDFLRANETRERYAFSLEASQPFGIRAELFR